MGIFDINLSIYPTLTILHFAGHVIDFQTSNIKVGIDYCDGFEVELPQTNDFENADFDLSQEYN